MTEQEFRELFAQVSNWGGFAEHPERGALNHLTPDRVVAAARLVRSGDDGDAQPAARHRGPDRQPRAGRSPHDDADRPGHRVRERALHQGLRRRRLPQRRPQPYRRLLARRLPRAASTTGCPSSRSRSEGAMSGSIDVLRDGLVGPGCAARRAAPARASHGWSRGTTCTRRISNRLSANRTCASDRATSCWFAPAMRAAARSCRRGTPAPRSPACIPPSHPFSPSAASQRWGPTATTTPRPAPPRASTSRSTSWRSTRWGSTCSTICSSRTSRGSARRQQRWEFLFTAAPLRLPRGTGSPLNPTAIL